jgi:hypothetical protein
MEDLTKQLVSVAKSIFKFSDLQRKTLGRWVITYIFKFGKSQRKTHEAKANEVTYLELGPLILLWAIGVVAGEVEVAEGGTRSGHHLLKLLLILLLLVPELVLLLVVALTVVIPLGVVILVAGGVELLPLRAVSDKVGGVTALKVAPRKSPPLLEEPVQSSKLSRQQDDLIVGDALILLIRSCT